MRRLTPGDLPILRPCHRSSPKTTRLRTRLNGPASPARFAAAWWPCCLAPCGWATAPRLPGMGAGRRSGRGGEGTCSSACGPGHPRPGFGRRPSGRPDADHSPVGRIRAMAASWRGWGCTVLLGSAAIDAAGVVLYLSEVMHLPQSWSTWMLDSFPMSSDGGLGVVERWRRGRGR